MKNFYVSKVALGIATANIVGFTILGMSVWLQIWESGVLLFSEFVILPFLMGLIFSWCIRKEPMKHKYLVGNSIINGLTAILLSAVLLGEGIICLLIVSPLIFGFIIMGTYVGRQLFKKTNRKLNISVFSLLFIVFITDSLSEHHYENMVSDEMLIKASPEEIWENVVAFEKIEQKNDYWLFQLGMPSPMATTVEGYHEGAGRKCIFSNGYVFDETIVTYQPHRNLTFDIVGQPQDPEIMGHIDILRGQFLLKDNGDGTTTLVGNSWYRLYVFPSWYYDIWARSITRNVHWRVMEHIRVLSEQN